MPAGATWPASLHLGGAVVWIESHDDLLEHPKTARAAMMLGLAPVHMVGHLHALWWWCMSYADDGDLSRFDAMDIALAARFEGDPDEFLDALVSCGPGGSSGFIDRDDEGIRIHDWEDYAGKLVQRRRANRQRMRKARAANNEDAEEHVPDTESARAEPVQRTCNERAVHVQDTCEIVQSDRTGPDRTRPDQPDRTGNTPARARAREPAAAAAPARETPPKIRDELFEAIAECWRGGPYRELDLTKSQRGVINKAVSELRAVGATPDQIREQWATIAARYDNPSPAALVKHWQVRDSPASQQRHSTTIQALASMTEDENDDDRTIDISGQNGRSGRDVPADPGTERQRGKAAHEELPRGSPGPRGE